MSSDADVLGALARAFAEARVRWYLFGAQAAILYGAARFTEDVDVTIELGERPTKLVVDALAREGLNLRITEETDAFVARTRVLPVVHALSGTPVDVVLSGPGIEELFFEHARHLIVEGVRVPVAAPEDLVVMKVLAGRPKDVEDATAVLAARTDDFDLERVRELLNMLEQALSQSDLAPVFEACLRKANRAR